MKKLFVLYSGIFLLLVPALVAQKQPLDKGSPTPVNTITSEQLSSKPFDRRNWNFAITRENIGYSHQNIKVNGVDQGTQSSFGLNLGANYFVIDGLAVGLELDAELNKWKNGSTQTNNSWMGYANVTYGMEVLKNVNIYGRVGAGLGGVVNIYKPAVGPETKDKSNLFGFKGELGFPLRLEPKGVAYLTPTINYGYRTEKFDDGKETTNRFGFGLKLETYLSCPQMSCDARSGYRLSEGIYDRGNSFLGFNTKGRLSFGNIKTDYDNPLIPDQKENFSKLHLSAEYMYYMADNFSLGLNAGYRSSVYKQSAFDYKQTNRSFGIMPQFELNMPVNNRGLNNLFIRGGYGFNTQMTETKNNINTNTTKWTGGDLCIGLGYNFFFRKGLSVTPQFEYDWATWKNKDTDQKEKINGPVFSVGIRKFFY